MATEVIIPKMGQTVEVCQLLEWFVKKGDTIEKGAPVFAIETDKASFDIEAPVSGVLKEVFFEAGVEVPVMTVVGVIGAADEDTSGYAPVVFGELKSPLTPLYERGGQDEQSPLTPLYERGGQDEQSPLTPLYERGGQDESGKKRIFISPRAKKLAKEKGIDYTRISGTGPNGRIKEADVIAYLESTPKLTSLAREYVKEGYVAEEVTATGVGARVTAADLLAAGKGEHITEAVEEIHIPVVGPRKIIAQKMFESLTQTAQLTLTTTVDASAMVEAHDMLKASRETLGLPKITYGDMINFAVSRTLLQHRELNAFFSWEEIVMPAEVHLAFAVDTPRGLLVPVIRNAHRKSLTTLAIEAKTLADQAKEGKINPDLLTGGTFTVSNLGQLGIEQFTPVLNPPQVGILGVGVIKKQPFEIEGGFEFRPVLNLSLTIDHRGVDGAPGARFLQTLKAGLENFIALLSL